MSKRTDKNFENDPKPKPVHPTDKQATKILLVEDDEAYIALVTRMFARESGKYQLSTVPSLKDAQIYLQKNRPDIVIAEMRLPDGEVTELLSLAEKISVPMIIITAYVGERTAVDAIKG